MMKKLSQFTDPAIMYAAGREVWVNNSVVKMLVTPPLQTQKQQKLVLTCATAAAEKTLQSYSSNQLPGPKPKLRIKANTHAMLK